MENLINALGHVSAVIGSSVGLSVITQVVKKIPFIPINKGQKVRIHAFVGVMSAVGSVALGVADTGTFDPTSAQQLLVTVVNFGTIWLTAVATYGTFLKKKE